MRKALSVGILAALGLSTFALAPTASASDLVVKVTKTFPVVQRPFVPDTSCGFQIDITPVKNQETDITTTVTKKDGTKDGTLVSTTDVIYGLLVLKFTNSETGKSFTRDVSGTTIEVDKPDGTATFVGVGNNWLGFGPRGQANTGEPGLAITHGPIKLTIANGTVQTFSLHGTQENGCALLS